jgi:hypothetical protein
MITVGSLRAVKLRLVTSGSDIGIVAIDLLRGDLGALHRSPAQIR